MSNLQKAESVILDLQEAVDQNDNVKILRAYEDATEVDWDNVSDDIFDDYDKLVDQANEILGV